MRDSAASSDPDPVPPEYVSAEVGLNVAGVQAQFTLTVPTAPVGPAAILPVLQVLSSAIEAQAVEGVEKLGRKVSCRAGCGACCRQLVPLSQIEARQISELVEQLPEPRRRAVKARFAEAIHRLEEAGLIELVRHPERVAQSDKLAVGLAYFQLSIACPFLEDESCSIHEARPLACREYLVTSPAANCAHPTAESIEMVPLPVRLSHTLARLGDEGVFGSSRWLALVLALEFAQTHPERSLLRPGPEWVALLFQQLSGQQVPSPGEGVLGHS
jgi:Fe-S-cluster containining protein